MLLATVFSIVRYYEMFLSRIYARYSEIDLYSNLYFLIFFSSWKYLEFTVISDIKKLCRDNIIFSFMYKNIFDTLFAQILTKYQEYYSQFVRAFEICYIYSTQMFTVTQKPHQLSLSPKTISSMSLLFAANDRIILKQLFLYDQRI